MSRAVTITRTEAAALSGMERQTRRDWVHRYNAVGPMGLVSATARANHPR